MSNQLTASIEQAKDKFIAIADNNPDIKVEWQRESMFAMQQIYKNDFSAKAAANNPASFRNAVINIASVGLSLNPATAYAYLVPRDGAICLDISYRGLIKIATDTGSIMWAKADIVYEADTFLYNGPAKPPQHTADPFNKERGEVVGCYCIAKTCDGDYLVEVMSEEEIQDIKDKSKSANSSYSPWNTFPNEMRKKAVIKRASKTWPKTERHERLDNVIEYVNNEEGINFSELKEEDIRYFDDLVHQKNGAAISNLFSDDSEYWTRIQSTFHEKGKTVKYKEMIKSLTYEALEYVQNVANEMIQYIEPIEDVDPDVMAAMESFEEMNEEELKMFWKHIDPDQKITIENFLNEHNSDLQGA